MYDVQSWEAADLPRLFSAANSIGLLQDKRLIVLLWLTNEQSNQEVIGQVNLKMSEVLAVTGAQGETKVKGLIRGRKIVIANQLMGYLDGEFEVEIRDGMAGRRASNSEGLVAERRRRTTKKFIKLKRDHSV